MSQCFDSIEVLAGLDAPSWTTLAVRLPSTSDWVASVIANVGPDREILIAKTHPSDELYFLQSDGSATWRTVSTGGRNLAQDYDKVNPKWFPECV